MTTAITTYSPAPRHPQSTTKRVYEIAKEAGLDDSASTLTMLRAIGHTPKAPASKVSLEGFEYLALLAALQVHGERPDCIGVALPVDLVAEPQAYTPQHNAWLVELREFAASWDGGAVPKDAIEQIEPRACPGCGSAVIIIHEY